MSFDTADAVYFLLRERSWHSSRQQWSRQVISRLVRVCRGDQGGLPGISEHYFGTLAKANLHCQSEVSNAAGVGQRGRFNFDFVQTAHWDVAAKRLYAVFTAGE